MTFWNKSVEILSTATWLKCLEMVINDFEDQSVLSEMAQLNGLYIIPITCCRFGGIKLKILKLKKLDARQSLSVARPAVFPAAC